MCALKPKTKIVYYTKNIQELLIKIGLGAGHSEPMELCTQRMRIQIKRLTQVSRTGHSHLEPGHPVVCGLRHS